MTAIPIAVRKALAAGQVTHNWADLLIRTTKGGVKALLANALIALRQAPECNGIVGFNEFTGRIVILRKTPWGADVGTEWTDQQDRLVTEWLQTQSIHVGVEVAAQAIQTVAEEHSFHPLRDWLNGLKWDEVPRIGTWLGEYLGVPDSTYSRAVGECSLVSAVARVFQPGCKADCMLVMEGPQGIKKSMAGKVLGGDYYTDEIGDPGSKDAAMQTMGVWIIEFAELDTLSRSETGTIKAFVSRTTDRFRPPYGRRLIESPRQCIFIGTVNHSTYLRDETGARRFWPVVCGSIDIEALMRDREQIWAEAVAAFRAGKPWWLDKPELVALAATEQAGRYEGDPWQESISEWAALRNDVSISEVLELCLGKPQSSWQQSDQNRVARCLRALDWERFYARSGTSRTGREWRYRRAE